MRRVGRRKAKALACRRGVDIATECADPDGCDRGRDRFDAIIAIFIQFSAPALRTAMFAGRRSAPRPDGPLILEDYGPRQLDFGTGGPSAIGNLYTTALLSGHSEGFERLRPVERDAELDEAAAIAHVGPGRSRRRQDGPTRLRSLPRGRLNACAGCRAA